MKSKISGNKKRAANNSLLKREADMDAAVLSLSRSVAAHGFAALDGENLPHGEVLRALMAALLTVASVVMERKNVAIWFQHLSEEIAAEERAEYAARLRKAVLESEEKSH